MIGQKLAHFEITAKLGEAEGVHFLAMELAEGEDLAAAHGKGIVHRDLKPANVMVDHDGEWLFFTTGAGGTTKKIWLEGTKSFAVCTASGLNGGDWGQKDSIVFSDGRSLWTVQADSTECSKLGEEHRSPDHGYSSPQYLPGEQELLVELVDSSNDPNAPQSSAAILSADSDELLAVVVHDAKDPRYLASGHLAYVTDTSGSSEVYVRTCPPCRPDLDLEEKGWRISLNGDTAPVWSRDGSEIFYLEGQKMMSVPVRTAPDFVAEAPVLLFEGTYLPEQFGNANYDVSPDGRFIMIKGGGSEASRHRINVVVNWFEEFGG